MGSITMRRVPMMDRMISGRNRMRSAVFTMELAGTGGLHLGPAARSRDAEGNVDLSLLQHAGSDFSDWRQEALRVDPHPQHHGDQRHDYGPFAKIEIGHV